MSKDFSCKTIVEADLKPIIFCISTRNIHNSISSIVFSHYLLTKRVHFKGEISKWHRRYKLESWAVILWLSTTFTLKLVELRGIWGIWEWGCDLVPMFKYDQAVIVRDLERQRTELSLERECSDKNAFKCSVNTCLYLSVHSLCHLGFLVANNRHQLYLF